MEITNFLTINDLTNFTMTLVMVELWVAFTKELPFIKKIRTKLYTFLMASIYLIIINTSINLFPMSFMGILVLLCNALGIATILCGGFDVVTGKITFNKNNKSKEK